MQDDGPAVCRQPLVTVVPSLPRAASIEWHVMAVVDEHQQRKTFVLMKSSENYHIKCEAIQSSTACSAAVVISFSLSPPSAATINLDIALHDTVDVFKQAFKKLSEDHDITPLGFRTFYQNSVVEMEPLRTDTTVSILEGIAATACPVLKDIFHLVQPKHVDNIFGQPVSLDLTFSD
uniref:Uncharacterized protein n=1 Tax=Sphaerodactylus townsendi TaxID=933632 RepID=A0ACB8G4A5_9SAUR